MMVPMKQSLSIHKLAMHRQEGNKAGQPDVDVDVML